MSPLHLSYDGLRVEVTSEEPDDAAWLAEFLSPSFEVEAVEGGPALRAVHLRRDPARCESLRERLAGADRSVASFILDSGPAGLSGFEEDGHLVVHDPEFDVFYRRISPSRVEILDAASSTTAARDRPRRARIALMRVVREWASDHVLRQGSLLLHASAMVCEGRAVLVTGARNAGKTSLLTACLGGRPRLGVLANDRVVASSDGPDWTCRGMPSIVSIRRGSFPYLSGIESKMAALSSDFTRRIHEEGPARPSKGDRYTLSPLQFARLMETRLVESASIAAIAFPRLDAQQAGACVRRLEPEDAADRLPSSLLAAAFLGHRSELLPIPESGVFPGPDEVRDRARHLARERPCFEVVLGPDAYARESLDAVLDQLFG